MSPKFVGYRTRPGWKGSLPFYRIRCPTHGEVETYPQGYGLRLECPKCQEERLDPQREGETL